MKRGTLIDGPITTETLDSAGEILLLEGLDITDFLEGKAFANFEHKNDSPEDVVGIFRYAKKIFKEEDCVTERQRMFWRQLQTPFLYGILELFDAEGHPGAIAIAAMLRYFKNRNEPIKIGFSIEGTTLLSENNILKRTVGRRCAITIKPCNKQCYFDVLPQEEAQLLLNKTEDATLKMVEVLSPYLPETDFKTVQKTLALGSSDVAPSQKVMGAALAKLNDQQKSKLYVLLRRWDKKRPLKDILKAHMPELDDDFVEHFEKIAHQLFLKSESEKSFPSKRSFKLDRAQTVLIPSELKFLYWDEEQLREHLRQGFLPARTSLSSVFLKRKTGADSKFSAIDRELAYYQLVRDFFQMPNHLVPINSIDLTSKELNLPVFANEPAQHGDWLIVQALNALPLLCCDIDLTIFFSNHLANLQKFALIDFCLGVEERLPASLLYNFDYQNFAIVDNDVAFLAPNPEKFVYCELIGDIPLEKAVCDWVQSLNLKELSKHLILLDIPQATMLDILRRLSILQQLCQESQPLLKKLLEQACQNFSQGDKND